MSADISLGLVEAAPDFDTAKAQLIAAFDKGATGIQLRTAWLNYRANTRPVIVRIGNEEQQ